MKSIRLKVKKIDILIWESLSVLINEKTAFILWLTAFDQVNLIFKNWDKKEKVVANINLTENVIDEWQIGIPKDFDEKYWIGKWDIVKISVIEHNPLSLQAIKRKLLWKKLTAWEIKALMRDMTDGKISDILATYYAACSYCRPSDDRELYLTAKYSAQMWDMIKFKNDTAVKYCIWWVPWNETTMIIVPILWSLWVYSPKTFSKSITSPAATWEAVEVLMDTKFSVPEMKRLVNKYWSCLALWKELKLAPANDKIIQVSYPLYMEAYAKVAVSIMAKIYAWCTKYCLIDIPVWKHGKIHHLKSAKKVWSHFEYIWKHLGMKMTVVFSNADAPVWRWIWAVFQCREALRILQNKEIYSEDIREKSLMLSAKLIELVWLAKWKKAKQLAEQQLVSWAAWEYMKQLIIAQNKVHDKLPDFKSVSYLWVVDSEDIPMAQYKASFISDWSWVVKNIDVENLKSFCRVLWAPFDKQAWFYLTKQVWEYVKKGDVLCEFYSNDKDSINRVIKLLWEKFLYEISK